jgi:hypothetical protein
MANTHYTVNETKKTVTYTIGSITDKEFKQILQYKEVGYDIIIKQKPKKSGITYDDMKKKAKGKPFEKELIKKIEAKENYMKIRKWYLEQIK